MISRSLLAPARLAGQSVLRTQSDERLADLARAGSEPAFEAIVARYHGALLGYCRGMLSDARAEDAVQQTFVKAFAALGRGEAVRTLRPWLYRIAHNTALNGLRDRSLHHAPLDETIDGVERPDQVAERRHELGEVVAAVKALPERQRDAILLRELEGRDYDEIAARLGVSYGAVRQLLNRARISLRAGVTALTPFGLLARLGAPLAEAPVGTRIAELCGVAGVAKVCSTVLATGAVAGAGAVPVVQHHRAPRAQAAAAVVAPSAPVRGTTTVAARAARAVPRGPARPTGQVRKRKAAKPPPSTRERDTDDSWPDRGGRDQEADGYDHSQVGTERHEYRSQDEQQASRPQPTQDRSHGDRAAQAPDGGQIQAPVDAPSADPLDQQPQ